MHQQLFRNQKELSWRSGLSLDRRTALQLMLGIPALIFGASAGNATSGAAPLDPKAFAILGNFLDILLPKTEESPSASEINLASRIIDLSRNVPNYPSLLESGLNWISETSQLSFQSEFLTLHDEKKEAVVTAAFAQADQTLPRVFAKRLRDDAMAIFYSHPASWPALGFEGPIQPSGFLDFEKAPVS